MKSDGLIAAVFTPLNKDGNLELGIVDDFLDALSTHVQGIFICGTTGEGFSLTIDERMTVAEAYVKASKGRFRNFIHVGHNSLQEACTLARHARHIGADAISALPPTYFKIDSVETLVQCMAEISAAAPDIPFYYYHIPALTGINFPMKRLLELAGQKIPAFAGIKFTDRDLCTYMDCLHYNDKRFDIMYGKDEMMLGALAGGARDFIGSTYNFMAPVYQQIIRSFRQNDLEKSREYQMMSVKVVELIIKYGGLAAQKVMLKFIGYDFGPVRLPLKNLHPEQEAEFREELEKIGFFNWINKAENITNK